MSYRRSVAVTAAVAALVVGTPAPAGAEPPAREWRLTTVAGNGLAGYSGDGGPATEARLGASPAYGPRIAVTGDGTLYLAEWSNRRLRRVTPDGVIDTVPGGRTQRAQGLPRAVAVGGDGMLYLATETEIRTVGADGSTEVVSDDSAPLVSAIAVDAAGTVYYANHFFGEDGHQKVSVASVDRAGVVRTIVEEQNQIWAITVDSAGTVYYTIGDLSPDVRTVQAVGPDGVRRVAATLPEGDVAGAVALGPDGAPHVVDVTRGQILRIGPQGTLTPVGPAMAGRIDDLAFRADGTPYLVVGATVRRLDRVTGDQAEAPKPAASRWADEEPGSVHRVAGTGKEWTTSDPGLSAPAVAPDGTVYVAEPRRSLVHAIGRDGRVHRFAGTGAGAHKEDKPDGKPANKIGLAYPHAVAVDRRGNVYLMTTFAILRVGTDGKVSTVTRLDAFRQSARRIDVSNQLAVDDAGTVYYTEGTGPVEGAVHTIADDGATTTIAGATPDQEVHLPGSYSDDKPATEATLRVPTAVSVGADGTVYVIETTSDDSVNAVRAVRPDGILVTAAGNSDDDRAGNFAGDGGPATNAELNNPRGVAAGPDGSFYVADTYNGRVRRVERTGVITTVAGTGRRAETGDGGPATEAALLDPTGLAVGADGTLYVTSAASTRVRAIAPDGNISTLADLGTPPTERPCAGIDTLGVGPDGTAYVGGLDGMTAFGADGKSEHVDGLAAQGRIATGPDGSLYQLVSYYTVGKPLAEQPAQLWRRYPDGTVLRLAADQPLAGVTDLAVGPDHDVYLTTATELFRLDDGGPKRLLSTGDSSDTPAIHDVAVGADRTPYVVVKNQVLAVRKGKTQLVAGGGNEFPTEEEKAAEEGGPARNASLESPTAVAVTRDGTVFVATEEGIRRVRQGIIETIDAGRDNVRHLAVTPSGDLYAATPGQVFAMVRPAELTIDRTSWTWVWLWVVAGALVLVAAGLLLLRRHRKKTRSVDSTD